LETAEFCLSLDKSSQTIAALKPKGVSTFDFTPSDLLSQRSGAGYFHLGDITLRIRSGTSGSWQNVTTSSSRTPVTAQTASGNVLAAADLAPALPSGFPLSVTRSWIKDGGRLVMRFTLKNTSGASVQIGALGIPMVFDNVISKDLQREGKTTQANDLETKMKSRADAWNTQAYPFASEMAWDSTGQEEVYGWTRHFKYTAKAKVCIDAITGYMPTVPHWGYNGNARRYWDFVYGGSKTSRIERMIHHYGSSLNAIPVLTEYRDHPDDIHLLRIGYAGMMGSLSNIDQDGFPSMAFHTFPDTLKWDGVSGDYGLNFFGHAHNAATYLINHPDFGWQAFGGNLSTSGNTVSVSPLDSMRRRFFVAPVGLWLTLDSGQFQKVDFDAQTRTVQVTLAPSTASTPVARLRIEQPAAVSGIGTYAPTTSLSQERGAYVVTLGTSPTAVAVAPK
jgi:hypothetical protein